MDLFTIHGEITYTFIFSLVLSNLLILPLGIALGKMVSKLITNIPVVVLVPFIFFLTIIGSYSINNNMFDVYVMVFFGVVGYVGRKAGFGPGPVVLGIILGNICEQGLVQSILMGNAAGSVLRMFFLRPISAILIVLTVMSAGWPFIRDLSSRRKRHEKR